MWRLLGPPSSVLRTDGFDDIRSRGIARGARARGSAPLRPARQGRAGMVPPRVHPLSPGARLRQGPLDARPGAAHGRGPDRVRGGVAHRGQPAQLPPAHPRHVRPGRWCLDQLDRPLDRGGRPTRHRPARLPDRHPQLRSHAARAGTHGPAPEGLRPRVDRPAPRTRLRGIPGARDAHRAPEHRALFAGSGRGQDRWFASRQTRTSIPCSTATS